MAVQASGGMASWELVSAQSTALAGRLFSVPPSGIMSVPVVKSSMMPIRTADTQQLV